MQESTTPEQTETNNIERYLDRLLTKAVVAGEAATAVREADAYRAEASQKLKAGRRDEARALLRQAGEVIAAAAPEGDAKQQDLLLREYLREITKQLVALDATTRDVAVAQVDGNFVAGNYFAQPRVSALLNYFQGRGRSRLELGRTRLARYQTMMTQIFREEGVPEWLISVGFVESTYNVGAHSPKQAHGIWQFMPGTGNHYGLRQTAWSDERGAPDKSTRAAARYLRDLHVLFGDWLLALAAYNWGEGHLAKVIQRTGIRDFWTLAERGLLPTETINYVPSVLAASQLLLGNKPGTDVLTTSRTSEEPGSEVGAAAKEGEEANFEDQIAGSKEIDGQISRLREELRGLPDQIISGRKRITNPEVMRINKEINRLAAESRRLRKATAAGNQESVEQEKE
jgi:hypothetical protein